MVDLIFKRRYRKLDNDRNNIATLRLSHLIYATKDINLALLLMPNNDSLTEFRRVDFNGIEYSMRQGDPKLVFFFPFFFKS